MTERKQAERRTNEKPTGTLLVGIIMGSLATLFISDIAESDRPRLVPPEAQADASVGAAEI